MWSQAYDPARLEVRFDDDHGVANAGLALTAVLAEKLGIEQVANEVICLGDRPGAARPGRKIMTLLSGLVAGGDCISDMDVLRAGDSEAVLGHRVMAPSTVGTFLRSFTFGHVRQLDRLFETALGRAWAAGAGPTDSPTTIDLDSTVTQVWGRAKQGAAWSYTHQLAYHPLLATRADTGEILHVRQRKGSAGTARGATHFFEELVARVRRAGATGPLTVRADSGFYGWELINTAVDKDVRFSVTVPQNKAIRAVIGGIGEDDWTPIEYTKGGEAEVAETGYKNHRLIVRRTRLTGPQATLWPDWRYHAFLTNRPGHPIFLDQDHRRHATVELAIRDWKNGAGANHYPSGDYAANAAWAVITALAHNLIRWTAHLGVGIDGPVVAKTIRTRLISIGGRITRSARRQILHLPTRWPWAQDFLAAFQRLRNLPAAT